MAETVLMTAGDWVRCLRNMGASTPLVFLGNPTHAELEATDEGIRVSLVGGEPAPLPANAEPDAEA